MTATGIGKNVDIELSTNALIDSGAQGKLMDKNFARENGIAVTPLKKPIVVYNVDGTENKEGTITHCTWIKLHIRNKHLDTWLFITGLEKEKIILELP